jgi:hypothetical protein
VSQSHPSSRREDPDFRAIEEGLIRRLQDDDLSVVEADFIDLDEPDDESPLKR